MRLVYTSAAQSPAALEMLVHLDDASDLATLRFAVIPVEVPEAYIGEASRLAKSWWTYPAPSAAARIGDG